ncbi:hypothetical protein HPB52_023757 [Rhipicephalus sanguineus]|uniref:Tick transposon n=1 Tax=Rhipicephalus sanguineus TaxID=34632 RepID=A0A9D4T0Z8_RHISA|nr:hypothetical protein HPB52_023757 [Rhipicephalus sanguineus]
MPSISRGVLGLGTTGGARVVEFAAAAGLVFLNDPASEPTYETAYAASWIDVTLATPSALAAGYTWQVRLDETFSEHKFIDTHIGDTRNEPRKRLTRYAQSGLLGTLAQRVDGTLTSTHLESAALLLETQIAVDSPVSDKSCHAATRQLATAPYDSPTQDVPFTETEVADVLNHMSTRSSPGPDSITPLLMRGLFRAQRKFVMMVLNAALRLGYFPRCWRSGRIIFIRKPGRPPQRTTSYRPICVTSVFGKTLERFLNARLYFVLWHNGYVHDNQFGFPHARSAVVALDTLKT